MEWTWRPIHTSLTWMARPMMMTYSEITMQSRQISLGHETNLMRQLSQVKPWTTTLIWVKTCKSRMPKIASFHAQMNLLPLTLKTTVPKGTFPIAAGAASVYELAGLAISTAGGGIDKRDLCILVRVLAPGQDRHPSG